VPAVDERCQIVSNLSAMQSNSQSNSNSPAVALIPSYQTETLRPAVSLIFIAPILLLYELACIAFDQPMRTGIDQWLHQFLDAIGGGRMIVLPIVTAGVLLFLHHQRKDNWQMKPLVFLGMSVESMVMGLILFCSASVYSSMVLSGGSETFFSIPPGQENENWLPETLTYFGAGIYEELVFRLLLLPALMVLFARWTGKGNLALGLALVLTSLLFAVSHYDVLNPAGVSLELGSFVFRFLASIIFCLVYLHRGFGVAVGTHVAYDILTQL
jgi:membrane protease YdiL (CAAX protease family)